MCHTTRRLPRWTFYEDNKGVWENECTPLSVRFGVRLYTAGMLIRETVAILDPLGVNISHVAVWHCV